MRDFKLAPGTKIYLGLIHVADGVEDGVTQVAERVRLRRLPARGDADGDAGERGVVERGASGWRQLGVGSRRNCKSIALWSPSWTRETIMSGAEALERSGRGFRQRVRRIRP